MKKVVIDIYGADLGAEVIIKGIARKIKSGMPFFPILVGERSLIDEIFEESLISRADYKVVDTSDYIGVAEPPSVIFGSRDESSMAKAYSVLKNDESCVALLSAGNTGALLVGAICRLGMVSKLKFPALVSALPCASESLLSLVDCGANINCSGADLVNFAKMGSIFSKCYCNIDSPRVGLMSVGREEGKGTEPVLQAYKALLDEDINFIGNLEGSDMVSGWADVVVTDGFSGNLLLKCTEAAGKSVIPAIEKLGLPKESLELIKKAVYDKFEFNLRGAAVFLGTKKTVVKMHGCATEETVIASLEQIERLENSGFINKIIEQIN